MSPAVRWLCALVLMGCATQAFAQANVQVTGTARNIPFPAECRASAGVQYTFAVDGIHAQFACNGIAYNCDTKPLKSNPGQVMSYQTGNPGTLQLNCGGTTTITGMDIFVSDLFPTLQSYIDAPNSDQEDVYCLQKNSQLLTAVNYDPGTHLFSFTCAHSTLGSITLGCYTLQGFGYDNTHTTLLMPDCIDGSDPTQSPYVLEDGYEEA